MAAPLADHPLYARYVGMGSEQETSDPYGGVLLPRLTSAQFTRFTQLAKTRHAPPRRASYASMPYAQVARLLDIDARNVATLPRDYSDESLWMAASWVADHGQDFRRLFKENPVEIAADAALAALAAAKSAAMRKKMETGRRAQENYIAGFDVQQFRESLRPGMKYREGFSSTIVVYNEEDDTVYMVNVLMQYNGTEMAVGFIELLVKPSGSMYLRLFKNYFRTKDWLITLRAQCFPHVKTGGILSSALYWLVKALLPVKADADALRIKLQAMNLHPSVSYEVDKKRQDDLQKHYEALGFKLMGIKADGKVMMDTSIANFLHEAGDVARLTFVFAPNAVHPMSTRNRTMQRDSEMS
jgi:hypothetical protein